MNEEKFIVPAATFTEKPAEYELKILSPKDYADGVLDGLDLVVQPGGSGASQFRALGAKGVEALKRFVRDGGKYYGVCAGSFLATQPYKATDQR